MATQIELPSAKEMQKRPLTEMELLQIALEKESGIDVIERIAALRDKALQRDAEIQFNEAMNVVQSELGRIAPDLNNPQTHSKYASYPAIDRILRPIYTRHGFSLSFDSGESAPETVRVYCYVSHRAGHTRKYQSPDMPADGKGAKGGDVMTKTHATGAAMSYAKRYLVNYIFNLAIGEQDTDGNSPGDGAQMNQEELRERLEYFSKCNTFKELEDHWRASRLEAIKVKDEQAKGALDYAKNVRKGELRKAGAQ